ncbi:MAG: NAD(P)-binding protein [Deltaproteobacteria bacterium]|nr:NAD(P)-binding protein [Deltaproteobacteria bacterium]
MAKKQIDSIMQLPVMPLTIEDMTWNKTGTWRLLTPVQQDKTAPCRAACPLGQPVPQMIHQLAEGDPAAALAALMVFNPMPGVTGRLCYHPCQAKCLRKEVDQGIAIQSLEKSASQAEAGPSLERRDDTGKQVVVCGSGPAGLAAAYFLGLAGNSVTVLEPGEEAGGFIRQAKSEQLPPQVLAKEIERLAQAAGVEIKTKATPSSLAGIDLVLVDASAHAPDSSEAEVVSALANGGPEPILLQAEKQSGFKVVQVAHALALGREAANRGQEALGLPAAFTPSELGPLATLEDIKLGFFAPAPASETPQEEASRCLSCGTCNLCQQCALSCPDACCNLDEAGESIEIDLYHCKGCGICSYECPRGALVMENQP